MSEEPKRKRGQLSNEEREFIRVNTGFMSTEDIAAKLSRTKDTIEKFQMDFIVNPSTEDKYKKEEKELLNTLKSRPFWRDIKAQFNEHEIEKYEFHWIRYITQFSNDVTHAEESQICKVIEVEILLSRILSEKNKIENTLERQEKDLRKLLQDPLTSIDEGYDAWQEQVAKLDMEITAIRNAQSYRSKEYMDFLSKHKEILKDLKATRDQRYKEIESSKVTFLGWMKAFDNPKFREEVSREAELDRLAKDKERERLSDYHKYLDGELDQPFLTPDTVKEPEDDSPNKVQLPKPDEEV